MSCIFLIWHIYSAATGQTEQWQKKNKVKGVHILQLHSHHQAHWDMNLLPCTPESAHSLLWLKPVMLWPCWPSASTVFNSQSKQANSSDFIQSWSSSTCTPPGRPFLAFCCCADALFLCTKFLWTWLTPFISALFLGNPVNIHSVQTSGLHVLLQPSSCLSCMKLDLMLCAYSHSASVTMDKVHVCTYVLYVSRLQTWMLLHRITACRNISGRWEFI